MREWLNFRHAFGVFLLYLFWNILRSGDGNVGWMLIAMCFLILAAMCFSRTFSELAARPFTRFVDAVYFGHDDRDPPPLNLKLAAVYRTERRYDEDIAEYERQLEYHPRSPELWRELVRTAREAGAREQADRFLRTALRRVKRGERMQLEREI